MQWDLFFSAASLFIILLHDGFNYNVSRRAINRRSVVLCVICGHWTFLFLVLCCVNALFDRAAVTREHSKMGKVWNTIAGVFYHVFTTPAFVSLSVGDPVTTGSPDISYFDSPNQLDNAMVNHVINTFDDNKRWFDFAFDAICALMFGASMLSTSVSVCLIIAVLWCSRRQVLAGGTGEKATLIKSEPFDEYPDGVYTIRVTSPFIWAEPDVGICYIERGIVSTCYHVACSQKLPLKVGENLYDPAYINAKNDIISWGGRPELTKIVEGENLYALIATVHGEGADRVEGVKAKCFPHPTEVGLFTYVLSTTRPGQSGSPVFVRRDRIDLYGNSSPVYLLVGHVGRNIAAVDGLPPNMQLEYIRSVTQEDEHMASALVSGSRRSYNLHCGYGKTRTMLPQLVEVALEAGVKIIITAPTNLICRDMEAFLRPMVEEKGSTISTLHAQGRKLASADVTVGPHAVVADKVVRGHFSRPGTQYLFIIDEYHVANEKSVIMMNMLMHDPRYRRHSVVGMSATGLQMPNGDYFPSHGSRHHIDDHVVRDEESAIDMALRGCSTYQNSQGFTKILVFASRERGSGPYSASTLKKVWADATGFNTYILSRSTFDNVKPLVSGPANENMVIVCTSVAEMGANLDVDMVIDYGRLFTYRIPCGNMIGSDEVISDASRVQRRGRVGRRRNGLCIRVGYWVCTHDSHDYTSVDFVEGCLFTRVMNPDMPLAFPSWASALSAYDKEYVSQLTPARAMAWYQGLNSGTQPSGLMSTIIMYTPEGARRTRADRDRFYLSLCRRRGYSPPANGKIFDMPLFDPRDRQWFSDIHSSVFARMHQERGETIDVVFGAIPPTAGCFGAPSVGVPLLGEEHNLDHSDKVHQHKCVYCTHYFSHVHQVGDETLTHPMICRCCKSQGAGKSLFSNLFGFK